MEAYSSSESTFDVLTIFSITNLSIVASMWNTGCSSFGKLKVEATIMKFQYFRKSLNISVFIIPSRVSSLLVLTSKFVILYFWTAIKF